MLRKRVIMYYKLSFLENQFEFQQAFIAKEISFPESSYHYIISRISHHLSQSLLKDLIFMVNKILQSCQSKH